VKKLFSALLAIAVTFGGAQLASAKTTKPSATVYFAVSHSTLTATTKSTLTGLARSLKATDVVDVRGYVQHSKSSANDISLATARAAKVKAFLVALGVKSKVSAKGYGLPTVNRSSGSSRRVDIYVTHKAVASPSSSPTSGSGSISGTIERNIVGGNCSQLSLDYVDLYQGNTLISANVTPAWSSTNGDCIYNFTFTNVPNGTYNVLERYTTTYPPMYWYGNFTVTSALPAAWTVVETGSSPSFEVRRSPDLVMSGSSITGVDFRTMTPP